MNTQIQKKRLLQRIQELGNIGREEGGKLSRIACSDADKAGRDQVIKWMEEAGLMVLIDQMGNVFGTWQMPENKQNQPVMIGSHIDTVTDAGVLDGSYGVLSAIEVVESLKEDGFQPVRPIVVAFFTNEEGVRYQPDMMGSLVYTGSLSVEEALLSVGIDGTVLGEELIRIGYAGTQSPGFLKPDAYIELHIEQGPILDSLGITIGAVENLQGISWQRVVVEGVANHAGTTPIDMRSDAGLVAA